MEFRDQFIILYSIELCYFDVQENGRNFFSIVGVVAEFVGGFN